MQFEALARRLPARGNQPQVVEEQGDAFDVSPSPVPGFVPPSFEVDEWPTGATVLLIEAAGAVGKTAAAHALADRLNWPIVRAERAQVGSYSLSGLVQDALGFESDYIRQLAEGAAGVVVDSLDEAHFRAGTENLLAFVQNVQKVSGRATTTGDDRRAPSVVLFSRTDTAEIIRMAFANDGIPLVEARVEFFDLTSARSFIQSYMTQRFTETKRPEYNIPLGSPRPFEKLRDARMSNVASVLLRRTDVSLTRDWDELRDFLGYVPVLVALAESLAVTNPSAVTPDIEARDQSDILEEIVEFILERERNKLGSQIQSKLQALLPASDDGQVLADSLYTPSEQCIRLAGYTTGDGLASPPPALLPTSVRPSYEEAVGAFLPDHPFIKGREFASVVFQDYVQSHICSETASRAFLRAAPESIVTTSGPFFARFLANHCEPNNGVAQIREDLVEQVVESWSQEGMLVQSESVVSIALGQDTAHLDCWRSDSAGDGAEIEFDIIDLSGAFHVSKPLRSTWIVADDGLILGDAGQHLILGPDVILVADEIVVEAETLRVATDGGTRVGVGIGARSITANRLQKVEGGSDCLHVFAPDPPPRLRAYRREFATGERFVPFQRFLDLRTILTSFRSSTKGGLAVLGAKLEGKIVGSNPHRQLILENLQDVGAVSSQGRWYYLDLNALGELGFGVSDFQIGQPSDAILGFLGSCGLSEE